MVNLTVYLKICLKRLLIIFNIFALILLENTLTVKFACEIIFVDVGSLFLQNKRLVFTSDI